jgi:hypothetical protein
MTRTRRIADRFAGFILAGVVSCSLLGAVSAAPPQSYDDLLAQAKQNATAVDFTALRYAYAESAQYNPYDPNDAELYKFMVNAMNARDCTSAMKHAQAILEKNYVRINPRVASAICYRQLNQAQAAAHHDAMARGLMDSILASGNGATAQTAFVVIAVDEEYSAIAKLGLKSVRQRLLKNDGHRFDVLDVTDKAGRTSTLFFNIDRLFAWYTRQNKSRQ